MYRQITDWSEVWALLIPLFFLLKPRNKYPYLKPIVIYICLALVINIFATLIHKFKGHWGFEPGDFFWSNNFLYNIHSIARLFLFSWFFILLNQRFMHRVKAIIPFIFLAFIVINFTTYENFFNKNNLSSRLLATEAAFLLFYCLQYYIFLVIDDNGIPLKKQPGFWVVIGLTFYVAASFFIFLFWDYLIDHSEKFAIDIWDVHNATYIFLCICIAISLNKQKSNES